MKIFEWLEKLLNFLSYYFMIPDLWALGKTVVEIAILAIVIYKLIDLVSNTRAWQLLKGVLVLFFSGWLASIFGFKIISYLLSNISQLLVFAIVVIFQDELKKILEKLGNSNIKNIFNDVSQDARAKANRAIEEITEACCNLSLTNTGALIVIEREIKLGEVIATGVPISSEVSKELIEQMFVPNTPLHDGAIVVREDKILAASCLLPLTSNVNLSKELGTRHRAAIGLTEISDCIVVVVSEETGKISVTMDGKIRRGFDRETLCNFLKNTLFTEEEAKKRFSFKRGNKK